jgi:hypothetical protein
VERPDDGADAASVEWVSDLNFRFEQSNTVSG